MTDAEYIEALRAAATAGDMQAAAMLRMMESRERRPFDCLPPGL